jgi:NAD(P)-dependent dehydrogenase (short-subunit alcohol dehydrogenase family)
MTPTPMALITGASKGIGRATAFKLAEQGYNLALASRSVDLLSALAQELTTLYPDQQFKAFVADFSQPMQTCSSLVQQVVAHFGRIDVLVNNAGVSGRIALLGEIADADIDATIQTNLLAPILLAKHVVSHMVSQGIKGSVVNISSIAGQTAFPYWSVYCASKFGLSALSQSLGEEQRSNHIRVCTIHPGAVDTPLWDGVDMAANRAPMLQADIVASAIVFALNQPDGAWLSELTLKPLDSVM